MPFIYPDNTSSYPGNFLNIALFRPPNISTGLTRRWSARATFFHLMPDHEQNCSTNKPSAVVGSSHVDPYCATDAPSLPCTALSMAAPMKILRMLMEIGSIQKVPNSSSASKPAKSSHGVGHRVTRISIRAPASSSTSLTKSFELRARTPSSKSALGVRAHRFEDEYFVKRKLYPNVISNPAAYINRGVSR